VFVEGDARGGGGGLIRDMLVREGKLVRECCTSASCCQGRGRQGRLGFLLSRPGAGAGTGAGSPSARGLEADLL